MQIGEQLSHSYELAGTYNVTVTALSGGAATTQYSEEITITDPVSYTHLRAHETV